MSALLAILILFGLVGHDEASNISNEDVRKIVNANYDKIDGLGTEQLVVDWGDGGVEGEPGDN